MQTKLFTALVSICSIALLAGTATAEPLSTHSLASTWVKLDTTNIQNKPYNAYAYGYSLLDRGAYCNDDKSETCQIIKLDATPFTKNAGKLHANMYYSNSNATCQAHFGEILFTIQNNTIEVPSSSYTTKWVPQENSGTEPAACPATTLTLTVSPLNEQESNVIKGYEFKIVENK